MYFGGDVKVYKATCCRIPLMKMGMSCRSLGLVKVIYLVHLPSLNFLKGLIASTIRCDIIMQIHELNRKHIISAKWQSK